MKCRSYKYPLSLLSLSFSFLFSFSQKPTNEYKWSIGAQINSIEKPSQYENVFFVRFNYGEWKHKSYSLGFVGSRVFNEDYFFRLRAGITNINASWHFDTRDNYNGNPPTVGSDWIEDAELKQNRYYFAPAIAGLLKKIFYGLYGGFELPLTIHKNYSFIDTETDYDTTDTTVTGRIEYTTIPNQLRFPKTCGEPSRTIRQHVRVENYRSCAFSLVTIVS